MSILEEAQQTNTVAYADTLFIRALHLKQRGLGTQALLIIDRALFVLEKQRVFGIRLALFHAMRANIQTSQGRLREAQAELQEARKLLGEPNRAPVIWAAIQDCTAALLEKRGRFHAASEVWKGLLMERGKLLPTDAEGFVNAFLGLSRLARRSGQTQEALEHAQRALDICNKTPEDVSSISGAQLVLAQALWQSGRRDEALRLAEAAKASLSGRRSREAPAIESRLSEINGWLATRLPSTTRHQP